MELAGQKKTKAQATGSRWALVGWNNLPVVGYSKKGLAATYSPACDSSTIGATGLNCSVRKGKR